MKGVSDFRWRIAHVSHIAHTRDIPPVLCTEEFTERWVELLNERDRQHGETYTPECLLAELQFCADEPDPLAVMDAVMLEMKSGKRKHQRKQLWPVRYEDYKELWGKVPPKIRYAVRTTREKRADKGRVTNTVFQRRSVVEAYLQEQIA